MVENGGILEEYLFIVKTDNKEDLKYLEDLLALEPKYKAQYSPTEGFDGHDYSHMWESVKKGNIYVKIDDDVVCRNIKRDIRLFSLLMRTSCSLKTRPYAQS